MPWEDLLKSFKRINPKHPMDILLYLMFGDDKRMYTSKKEMYESFKELNTIDWVISMREVNKEYDIFKSSLFGTDNTNHVMNLSFEN